MIIENSFDVDADPDRVFDFLQNPHNVATCFPGAELTEDLGDDRYKGKVKVKLGPVTAAFSGTAKITEKDAAERLAVLVAEGKDARGSGTAKATATMRVSPKEEGGGSSVQLRTDLTISGRLAQFGRGIMADVSNRMVGDLAERVRERIESESAAGAAEAEAGAAGADAGAVGAAAGAAGAKAGAAEPAAESGAASAGDSGAEPAGEPAAAAGGESGAASGATSRTADGEAAKTGTDAPAKPAEAPSGAGSAAGSKAPAKAAGEPESALQASTLLKVMIAGMFRRLFARLRGRSVE